MTRNFSKSELECPCCSICDMDPVLLTKLQALRDAAGFALPVNSGFRCKKHNRDIGGGEQSQHLFGFAVDISTNTIDGIKRHRLMKLASALEFGGIGVYPSFIHLDIRERPALWVDSSN